MIMNTAQKFFIQVVAESGTTSESGRKKFKSLCSFSLSFSLLFELPFNQCCVNNSVAAFVFMSKISILS